MTYFIKSSLRIGLVLVLTTASAWGNTVTVDPLQRFQTMRGFGSCLIPWSGTMRNLYESAAFQRIYAEDMAFSLLRVDVMPYVHPQVSDPDNFSYQNFNIRTGGQANATNARTGIFLDFAKAIHAVNPEVKVILTVWSFPDWMKTNNSHLNGGSIKPSHYEHAAAYLIEHARLFEAHGVPVLGVSFANEPQFAQAYNSQKIDPPEYAEMTAVLGRRLADEGLDRIMIFGPEHMTYDTRKNSEYIEAIRNHPTAWQYFDAFASHGYTDGVTFDPRAPAIGELLTQLWKPGGYEFWMTEAGTGDDESFAAAVNGVGSMVHSHVVDAEASVYTPWQLAGESPSEHIHMVLTNHRPKSRVLQHYSSTFLPGMVQIGTHDDGAVRSGAFANPEEGTLGIVLLNTRNISREVTIRVAGIDTATFDRRRSSSSNHFELLPDVFLSGGEMRVTVPGPGVVSLRARDVDFSGVDSMDSLMIANGREVHEIPGYGTTFEIPVKAPEGYEWTAALSSDRVGRIQGTSGSGTGDGAVVIRVGNNLSEEQLREFVLDVNSRRVLIRQRVSEEPPPPSFWNDVAADPQTGARETARGTDEIGIGWIYDAHWPLVWSYSLNAWLYISPSGSRDSFYSYDYSGQTWVWASANWGGYYDFEAGWKFF